MDMAVWVGSGGGWWITTTTATANHYKPLPSTTHYYHHITSLTLPPSPPLHVSMHDWGMGGGKGEGGDGLCVYFIFFSHRLRAAEGGEQAIS